MQSKYRNRNRYPSPRNCFICNKPNHIATECNNQYCQRCGTWGHGMKMCNKDRNNRPAKLSTIKENDQGDASVPDETVIVDIDIEGHN